MVHVYVAVQAYANRVLKYQGQCVQEDMDKMFPGVHYTCFDKYMGDRIVANFPHFLVTGTSGDFDKDVTGAEWLPPVLCYWVVCITIHQEFLKWGQDAHATIPFHDRDEVEAEAAHLVDGARTEATLNPDAPDDLFFVMTVFNDGQIMMEQLDPVAS